MISPALVAIALGSQLVMTVADDVPVFDVAPGCRAAAAVTPAGFDSCMNDERGARAVLQSGWDRFAASDRMNCTQTATEGGSPSYVELLTCLQMAQAARSLPSDKVDGSGR
jgi:hypothetical protein